MSAKVRFHYIKAPTHSEVKVDGAIGGGTPGGDGIIMSVYTERPAIPRYVVHSLSEEGVLGEELIEERDGKDGIVRSVHATLHMDLRQAKSVHQWLEKHIKSLEQIQETDK